MRDWQQEEIKHLQSENRRLKIAFTRLESHYKAAELDRQYNWNGYYKIPKKPERWW